MNDGLRIDVRKLSRRIRTAFLAWVVSLAVATAFLLYPRGVGGSQTLVSILEIACPAAMAGLSVCSVVVFLTISRGYAYAAVDLLVCLLPVFGHVHSMVILHQGIHVLRSHGLHAGLWGVSAQEFARWRPEICAGCGYDLSGIDGRRCPECGVSAGHECAER